MNLEASSIRKEGGSSIQASEGCGKEERARMGCREIECQDLGDCIQPKIQRSYKYLNKVYRNLGVLG